MKKTWMNFSFSIAALSAAVALATLVSLVSGTSHTASTADVLPASASPVADNQTQLEQKDASGRAHTTHPMAEGKPPEQHPTVPADVAAVKHFQQGLRDYSAGNLNQEDKILMENALRELNASVIGRALIVDTFFTPDDSRLAAVMHELILDADLKDASLITALIDRDKTEYSLASKKRIIDLIADLSSQDNQTYSPEIDEYLAQMAQHPNTTLRDAAKSQRAWYLIHHQPDNVALVEEYLLDSSPDVRQEMYELVESRASSQQPELALALESLLHADYLAVSHQEEQRIIALRRELGLTVD